MKDNVTAYILWFFLGGLGIHAFYAKKTNWGLFTLLTWFLAICFVMFDGGVMMFVHIMNVLVQAFLIPSWVKKANEKEAEKETALIEKAIKKARGEDATNNEKP